MESPFAHPPSDLPLADLGVLGWPCRPWSIAESPGPEPQQTRQPQWGLEGDRRACPHPCSLCSCWVCVGAAGGQWKGCAGDPWPPRSGGGEGCAGHEAAF